MWVVISSRGGLKRVQKPGLAPVRLSDYQCPREGRFLFSKKDGFAGSKTAASETRVWFVEFTPVTCTFNLRKEKVHTGKNPASSHPRFPGFHFPVENPLGNATVSYDQKWLLVATLGRKKLPLPRSSGKMEKRRGPKGTPSRDPGRTPQKRRPDGWLGAGTVFSYPSTRCEQARDKRTTLLRGG
jgi:hypothetical protein